LRPGFRKWRRPAAGFPGAGDHAIQLPFSPPAVVLPTINYSPFVALHQGFRPQIPNYLEMELRYMGTRGMRLKNIQAGP
jgi:hypothetical protein